MLASGVMEHKHVRLTVQRPSPPPWLAGTKIAPNCDDKNEKRHSSDRIDELIVVSR